MRTLKSLIQRQRILHHALGRTTGLFSQNADNIIKSKLSTVSTIPTGILSLDKALTVGGLPRGYITEVYGDTSSGKTTLALKTIANIQHHGGTCAYIDTEYALNAKYAKHMNINLHDLWLVRPTTEEQCLNICYKLLCSKAIDLIVIDSIAGLVPAREKKESMTHSHATLQSHILLRWLKEITSVLKASKTAMLLLNQTRMKIGVVFGSPDMTPCSKVLNYYSALRVQIKLQAYLYAPNHKIIGQKMKLFIKENKLAIPFQSCNLSLFY